MFDSSKFIPSTEQNTALDIVRRHLHAHDAKKPLQLLIYGEAGSGKRTLASMIAAVYGEYDRDLELVSTSVLDNVAWMIGGFSLASIGLGATGFSDNEITKKWADWSCLLLLNGEQASPDMFDDLCALMRRAKCNEDTFGGMDIIVSADFMQGFAGPYDTGYRLYCHAHLLPTASAIRGRAAFLLLSKAVILKAIPNDDDSQWLELLRRVRHGLISADDLANLRKKVVHHPLPRYRGYMVTNDIDLMRDWNRRTEEEEKNKASQYYAVVARDVPQMPGRLYQPLLQPFTQTENAEILSPLIAGQLLEPQLIIIENGPCITVPGFVIEPFGVPGNVLAFFEAVKVTEDEKQALIPAGVDASSVEIRVLPADKEIPSIRRHATTGDLFRSKRDPYIFCKSSYQVFVGVQGGRTTVSRVQHAFQPAWSIFYDSVPGLKIRRPILIDIMGLRWFKEGALAAFYTILTRGPNNQTTTFWREVPDEISELAPPEMVIQEERRIQELVR